MKVQKSVRMDRLVENDSEKDSLEDVSVVARKNDTITNKLRRTGSAVPLKTNFTFQNQRRFACRDLTRGLTKKHLTQSMERIVYKKLDY